MLFCFHSAGVLHTFVLLNLSGLETSFYRKKNCNGYVRGSYCIIVKYIVLHVICEYLHELYTLNSILGSKELNKYIPRDSLISQFYFNLCSVLITLEVSTHFLLCNLNHEIIFQQVFERYFKISWIPSYIFQRFYDYKYF